MLGQIIKLFTAKKVELPEQLDYRRLPVMSGSELISFLNQTNKIRSIKRKVMIDSHRFEKMYLEPIHKFCELVQLAPASQAYHHTFFGGLIIHTLSVVEYAINERQKHTLPMSSDPEIIEAQRNLWTYAIFMAALCHDVGKIVTMITFVDCSNHSNKQIMEGTLLEQDVNNYQIGFKPTDHFKIHQSLGACFLPILFDRKSLGFVADNLEVFAEVLAYIKGDSYEWGSVGSIVQVADRRSTAESLKIGTDSRKFPGADLENFGERIMRTLRVILNNSSLPKNRAGAALWSNKHFTYAISKPFAEMIRDEMKRHGATDVPSDNTRIFDELQQQGFCESNEDGQAIFRIEVALSDSNFKQTFTCIKIKNSKLYHANNLPQPIVGRIVEVVHDDIGKKSSASTAPVATTSSSTVPNKAEETFPTSETEPQNVQQTAEPAIKSTTESGNNTNTPTTGATAQTPTSSTNEAIDQIFDDTMLNPLPKRVGKPPVQVASKIPGDVDVVETFFNWVWEQVEEKEYTINRDSPLYIVEYNKEKHLAMMSPIIFAHHAKSAGYVKDISVGEPMKKAADIVQKAFHHQKVNVAIAGQQVHSYRKTNSPSARTPKLSFYLIPVKKITNRELREIVNRMEISTSIERFFKS